MEKTLRGCRAPEERKSSSKIEGRSSLFGKKRKKSEREKKGALQGRGRGNHPVGQKGNPKPRTLPKGGENIFHKGVVHLTFSHHKKRKEGGEKRRFLCFLFVAEEKEEARLP